MTPWYFNPSFIAAMLACVAVVAIPVAIRVYLHRRRDSVNRQRLADATRCDACGSTSEPIGSLDFVRFEGYFLNAWKQYHVSTVVCSACARAIVSDSRRRILKTWWRSLQGPIAIVLTFANSRGALAKHARSLKQQNTEAANKALEHDSVTRADGAASGAAQGRRSAHEMKKFLHNVAERIKSMRDGRTQTVYDLSCDQSGAEVRWLTIENERGSLSFQWDTVTAVDTFKRDLFAVDCICLAFETPNGWIEVNEDMNGWSEFLNGVESALPGFPRKEEWWGKVMIPAFETNHATLWTKGKQNKNIDDDSGIGRGRPS